MLSIVTSAVVTVGSTEPPNETVNCVGLYGTSVGHEVDVADDGTPTAAGVDYFAKLDALTGVRRLRLKDGIWASAEGVIYEDWDEAVHVIDRFPIPPTWRRWSR